MTQARELAELLIEHGAIEIRPDPADWFTWASGRRAPVYCDNRRMLSFPSARARIAEALSRAVRREFEGVEMIAGTATAGIAWAALVAERLDLPMVYVRGEAKGHGRHKRVEGRSLEGETLIVLEDLLSFGGSALSAARALQEEGGKVAGVQAIVSWGFAEAEQRLSEAGLRSRALVGYPEILDTLRLSPEQTRVLLDWRAS
ncbi:MAG: orotate phosphoribosyltransferase [Myxococcota bacterium]